MGEKFISVEELYRVGGGTPWAGEREAAYWMQMEIVIASTYISCGPHRVLLQ